MMNAPLLDTHQGVSLVLGGGAVRGYYHLGVLRALRERGVAIREIIGTSVGALVGAILAARPDADIAALMGEVSVARLVELTPIRPSVLGTRKIERALRALIPIERFEDLQIPLTVIATDINTGEEVVFRSGPLFPALLASMAIPGVFPLVEHGGRVLADGGVVDNLPVRHATGRVVVASDVTFALQVITPRSGKVPVVLNALYTMMRELNRLQVDAARAQGKNVILLELNKPIFAGDVRRSQLDALIAQGYEDARAALRGYSGMTPWK